MNSGKKRLPLSHLLDIEPSELRYYSKYFVGLIYEIDLVTCHLAGLISILGFCYT